MAVRSPVVSERIKKDDIVIVRWHLGQHFHIQYSGEFGARDTAPVVGKRFSTLRASRVECFSVFWPHWVQKDGSHPSNQMNKRKSVGQLCFRHSTWYQATSCICQYPALNNNSNKVKPKEKAYESARKHQPYSNRGCPHDWGCQLTRIPKWKCCPRCHLTSRFRYVPKRPDS